MPNVRKGRTTGLFLEPVAYGATKLSVGHYVMVCTPAVQVTSFTDQQQRHATPPAITAHRHISTPHILTPIGFVVTARIFWVYCTLLGFLLLLAAGWNLVLYPGGRWEDGLNGWTRWTDITEEGREDKTAERSSLSACMYHHSSNSGRGQTASGSAI